MPFLMFDRQGRRLLFYCRPGPPQPNRAKCWKLWLLDDKSDRQLHTGLGEEVVECSPSAWCDDDGWHVTFIAGGAKEHPLFRLWQMNGKGLDELNLRTIVHAPTRAGFAYRDRVVHALPEERIYIQDLSGHRCLELPGAVILRVSYRADMPDVLLIAAQWRNATDVFTVEYDLATGDQYLLESGGTPAYKCSIFGDEMIYAERIGGDFEERRLVQGPIVRKPFSGLAVCDESQDGG